MGKGGKKKTFVSNVKDLKSERSSWPSKINFGKKSSSREKKS